MEIIPSHADNCGVEIVEFESALECSLFMRNPCLATTSKTATCPNAFRVSNRMFDEKTKLEGHGVKIIHSRSGSAGVDIADLCLAFGYTLFMRNPCLANASKIAPWPQTFRVPNRMLDNTPWPED